MSLRGALYRKMQEHNIERARKQRAKKAYQKAYKNTYYSPKVAAARGSVAARRDLKAGGRKSAFGQFGSSVLNSGAMRAFAEGGRRFTEEGSRNISFGPPSERAFGIQSLGGHPYQESRHIRHRKKHHGKKTKTITIRI